MRQYRSLSIAITVIATLAVIVQGVPFVGAVTAMSETQTAAQQQRLQTIITKGNQEIDRRLVKLGQLSSKISSAIRLSVSDKATLAAQLSSEISNLTTLRTKLDAETTVAAAGADAKTIVSGYRVYALIAPKVNLVRVADDQQVLETKLADVIAKLQANVTAAKNAGKDVTSLQLQLDAALAQQKAALVLSTAVQAKVLPLQPSDYNSDHMILEGQHAQLVTAHSDIQAAYKAILAVRDALKKLA